EDRATATARGTPTRSAERSGNAITWCSEMSSLRRVLRVEPQVVDAVSQLETGHVPEAPARDVRRPEAPQPSSAPALVPEGARALLAGTAEPSHECENCGKPLS